MIKFLIVIALLEVSSMALPQKPRESEKRPLRPRIFVYKGPGVVQDVKPVNRRNSGTLNQQQRMDLLRGAYPELRKLKIKGDYFISPNNPSHGDWIALAMHKPWIHDGGLASYALFSQIAPPDPMSPINLDQAAAYWAQNETPTTYHDVKIDHPFMKGIPDTTIRLPDNIRSFGGFRAGIVQPGGVPGFVQIWIKPQKVSTRYMIDFTIAPDYAAIANNATLFQTYAHPYQFRILATDGKTFSMDVPNSQLSVLQHFVVLLEPTDLNWRWFRLECHGGPWLFYRAIITDID